jgi:DNA-binding NarL/FixJ family response regulator
VLLVDDHPIVRQGLKQVINREPDLEVCGEAETAREARRATREQNPDAVVVDLSLRDGDGIELIKDLRAHHRMLPLLVLSMHDESVYAERLLMAGASGYIMKEAASDLFLTALRRVLEGGTYVSPEVSSRMIDKLARGSGPSATSPVEPLSNRELQIVQMIGQGRSTREIADALNLSIKTVESHRQRIKSKLGIGTSSQLVQFAASWAAGRSSG